MIYERIKVEAEKKDMPISKLEKEAGLGNGTVGGWRNGEPTANKLFAVAEVLGVTVDYLLTGKTS